jgi:hypothetical protein
MQTPNLTYDWKVDFAVIISSVAFLFTFIRWYLDSRYKRKREKIQAYEEIFDDACYILEYPIRKRQTEAKQKQYVNSDSELQLAVRKYLDSYWIGHIWGATRFTPPRITDIEGQLQYIRKIQKEANAYRDSISKFKFDIDLPEMSPVFHLSEPDIKKRLLYIISYVGRHLSQFSDDIQRAWQDSRFDEPEDVHKKYDQALASCKNFFKYNNRDFTDPYYDLLNTIRRDYRELTSKRFSSRFSKQLWSRLLRLRWSLESFIWKIIHPIENFKNRRILKDIENDVKM